MAPKQVQQHQCKFCNASFDRVFNLKRHVRTQHKEDDKDSVCDICGKGFSRDDNLKAHRKLHFEDGGNINNVRAKSVALHCDLCGLQFKRNYHLKRHQRTMHIPEMPSFECNICDKVFKRADHLKSHRKVHDKRPRASISQDSVPGEDDPTNQAKRRRTGENGEPDELLQLPGGQELPVDLIDLLHNNEPLQNIYRKQWKKIQDSTSKGKIRDTYNFRLLSLESEYLSNIVHGVFEKQKTAFKVNAAFGFVLRNKETNELRYHYSSSNTRILTAPFLIKDGTDLISFLHTLLQQDPLEHAQLQRPNSKWLVDLITNITLYVYRIPDHPIGTLQVQLPKYIQENRAIVGLTNDPNKKGGTYHDNLCFFRCLALHQGCHKNKLEKTTAELFHQYSDQAPKKFKGVKLSDLNLLEEIFKVNIVVYEMVEVTSESETLDEVNSDMTDEAELNDDTNSKVVVRLVQRSLDRYKDTLYLNQHEQHFSYITDINKYSKSFACRKCQKLWKSGWQLTRHEATCEAKGTTHSYPGGYYVTPPSIFEQLEDEGFYIQKDERNFPYRATYDIEVYLDKSVASESSEKLMWEAQHIPVSVSVCSNVPEYESPTCFVTDGDPNVLIDQMMTYLLEVSHKSQGLLYKKFRPILNNLDSKIDALTPQEGTRKEDDVTKKQRKHLQQLKTRFENYLKELPVIGFNSGKYDLNIIKPYIYDFLQAREQIKFIVKRNSDHMCIKTESLKFIDIMNFLAPGFSLEKFLKAYDCSLQKGLFPYEWLDSRDKLDINHLPPREAFRSELKNTDITEEDYHYCQKVWEENDMTNMRDYLIWYNNRDVEPFIEALDKMNEFYKIRGIDTFKDGISIPGLTLKYLFKTSPEAEFSLFDEKNKNLHDTFKRNLVGGPSIIFHRYQEVDKTQIRGGKTCQKVIGYDANALYLWAMMQEMPTGMFIRRMQETGFKRERTPGISMVAQEWLRWEAHTRDIHIRHNGNDAEKRIGPKMLPIDGFYISADSDTKLAFEMNGCWWHGHNCELTKGVTYNETRKKSMKELYQDTLAKKKYIEDSGYEYVGMWECEFRKLKQNNKELQQFIHTIRPPLYHKTTMTQDEIIQGVLDDKLFGCVECDIHVPDVLKPYFEEMPPVFKNADISIQDIGPFMREFAEDRNIMSTPRRSLIGSMFGEKILLSTPLLKWYLLHGLQVTCIYQVVEYIPKACFKTFGNAVSDARRAGDVDSSKAIIADTMKLMGNSSYGKTITNKDRHMNIKILNHDEARKKVNEPLFRDIEEITADCHEVVMAKKIIKENLPIQIGFFVYQYAKLRMLEFYFDFLDVFVDRSDFQYVEMDTDSAYIAISGDSIEDIVKPDLRERFQQEKGNWFPREDTEEHRRYDKRTPGLFKVEWEGDGIIALCSKTYYCFGTNDKFSCKGVNKRNNVINKELYLRVLTEKQSASGINRGFRMKNNAMYTYAQTRDGFTYFYPKRKILDDGISTTYLDI